MRKQENLEQDALHVVVTRLADTYADTHSTQDVESTVEAVYHRFDGSRVRAFVPLLVENGARQLLRATSQPASQLASALEEPPASAGLRP